MRISLIVAVSENGVIGRDNDLPWHISADLRRFKKLTLGHHLIMGRRTYESIGRPLPGREIVVVSRRGDYAPEGVAVAGSVEEAVERARGDDEVFVAGGGEIYRQCLDMAHRIYLTAVHGEVEGDVRFPALNEDRWRLVWEERHEAESEGTFEFSFRIYDRATS